MIDCAAATDLLLTAEPAELRGAADSELAAHIRACATCRSHAHRLLAEQAALAHALDTLTARHTAVVPPRSAVRRWLPRIVVPLAAAAAAVIVLLARSGERNGEPLPPLLVAPAGVAEIPVVNASSEHNVAVMRTSNPDITVVWYY